MYKYLFLLILPTFLFGQTYPGAHPEAESPWTSMHIDTLTGGIKIGVSRDVWWGQEPSCSTRGHIPSDNESRFTTEKVEARVVDEDRATYLLSAHFKNTWERKCMRCNNWYVFESFLDPAPDTTVLWNEKPIFKDSCARKIPAKKSRIKISKSKECCDTNMYRTKMMSGDTTKTGYAYNCHTPLMYQTYIVKSCINKGKKKW